MRPLVLLSVLALGLAACGGSKPAAKAQAIAFGTGPRDTGSYAVIISHRGAVHPESAAISRRHLSSSQVASLTGLAQQAFAGGLAKRSCPGARTDMGGRFIDAAGRNVFVRGDCEPRFNALWKAFAKAVGLRLG